MALVTVLIHKYCCTPSEIRCMTCEKWVALASELKSYGSLFQNALRSDSMNAT